MIDFHAHILPGMDDGSKSVAQSLDMFQVYSGQNVEIIVATPHFYRESESIDSFLERRHNAYTNLVQAMPLGIATPNIVLAAEVSYFDGISREDEIETLCIGNSRAMLLEMPFEKWCQHTLNEVRNLTSAANIQVIIAHAERYIRYGNNKRDLFELVEMGSILQINASKITMQNVSRIALELVKCGNFCVLGSDCHDAIYRSPNIIDAYKLIIQKLGIDRINQIEVLSKSIIAYDNITNIIYI